MTSHSFEKRMKRRLIARPQKFFVTTAPGLETVCRRELKRLPLNTADVSMTDGGIEFQGALHDAYAANLHLRTANRILMRLASFKATNFRQLSRHICRIPWEFFLHPDSPLEIRVSTHHSRLYHTGAIADHVKSGIRRHVNTYGQSDMANETSRLQRIFLRAQDDIFTVSIDSSGELLYKRGIKTHVGKAPIRETLASAILSLAGYDPALPLMDPMAGSGTFSLEAAMITLNIPPGWYREFAFMEWPSFQPGRWKHLRREAEKAFKTAAFPRIFASDNDQSVCRHLSETVTNANFSHIIQTACKDFFSIHPDTANGLIIINPPYGQRLGNVKQGEILFQKIVKKFQDAFNGWSMAVLMPDHRWIHHVPFKVRQQALQNGGLDLTLLTGCIR